MNLKQLALSYADLFFAVFPLRPGGKAPAIKDWPTRATADKAEITKWWDENPAYNIGIATGAPSGGLVVVDLDIDPAKGKNGLERLSMWQKTTGLTLPDNTATAKTGKGGQHIFYLDDGKHSNVVDLFKDGSGIDVRADGGYIVAPGSVHPNGNRYTWIRSPEQSGIAQANHAVRALLHFQKEPQASLFCSPETVGEGERNSTMFKLASSLVAKGLSQEAIMSAVVAENESKCSPPLPLEELSTIVNSALRYTSGTSPYNAKSIPLAIANYSTDLICLSDTEEKDPEWLIDGYIPRREITIIAGDGGTGKTFAWCALAAAVSSGYRSFLHNNLFTDSPEKQPEKVMFFSSEDSYEYVLRRRLRKNGANLHNIITLDCTDERFSAVALNSDYLERLLADHRPALCIFDPLQSFIAGANMISRSEMRECMKRLHAYGDKYGTTFLIIMHTNKMQGVSGRNRLSDSSDIWDIARSVLIIGRAGDGNLRYVSHEKSNYGPQERTVLYDIADEQVIFRDYSDKRDREFVLDASRVARKTPAADEAENFILSYLDEHRGSCAVGELDAAAKANGITSHALKTAKERLKAAKTIKIERIGNGQRNGHQWRASLYNHSEATQW